ncbi:MAG: endonuclease [Flavobacteriaceae bacterium]
MKQITIIFFLIITQFTQAQIVINEVDSDTVGTDTKEFIELKSDTPNFPLDGYVVVLFNGSTNGADSSYYNIDLNGYTTDINGLLLIGSVNVSPVPQLIISTSVIQNGADAVAIYSGSFYDFLDGTLATTNNLIDALVYDTSDPDDTVLMNLLGVTTQTNENENGLKTTESVQRDNNGNYFVATPTPRQLNDGTGIVLNGVNILVTNTQYNENDSFDITFETEENVTELLNLNFTLANNTFTTADYTGNTSLSIPVGQNSVSTTITLIDDAFDEGDEELIIQLADVQVPFLLLNNAIKIRIIDNDYQVAGFGTPLNPTYNVVQSTQPNAYYNSLDGLADASLRSALQDIISEEYTVRAQTYTDIITILKTADQNPENSNEVWLAYTEQTRPKLDYQTTSNSVGKWNREHTFPRSRGGFQSIEADDVADGINNFWETHADSLRHGNSDAHAIRAVDGPENSVRGNQHYGQYNGPTGSFGSFKGDVARSVFFLAVRYNGLDIVNGYPNVVGELGDLATLLDWHRNDPPDDFEMNRNNFIYTWQFNRNPFIDMPLLIEYIWGTQVGNNWSSSLNLSDNSFENSSIYPNPTKDRLFFKGIQQHTEITIFTIDGKTVLKENIQENDDIPISLESGVYLLKMLSNKKHKQQLLIIE